MSLVSVIMPVYNGEKYLAEAIDSILGQSFTDFELLIVDDGSIDGSAEIIRAYQQRDRRIRFFQLERNMGLADARNRGIAAATGKFITMMDCDDISLPERLQKQVDFMQSNPEIGAVGVCGQAVNEDMTKLLFDLNAPERHCDIVLAMFVGVSFIHTTIMLRSEFLSAVGGYEEGRYISEDRELIWRLLWETSIQFANLPEKFYMYRRHEHSLSHTQNPKLRTEGMEVKTRVFYRLWNEAPEATINRFYRMAVGRKLGWAERRAAKQDMVRLIESIIAEKLVDPDDEPLLVSAMNRRLEQASPRLWQKFCYWRRCHFQRP